MVVAESKGGWRMKMLFLSTGLLLVAAAARAESGNVYAVPLSSSEQPVLIGERGVIELPATITGRVSSASSRHLVAFYPRLDYGSKRAVIYTNTGTGSVFKAELYVGEEDQGVLLPYNIAFNSSTPYVLAISASAYTQGDSYAVRIGLSDTINVAFDGNGGTASANQMSYTLGGKYGKFPAATRIGYDFTGWGTAGTNGVVLSTNTQVCVGYTTLYAQWKGNPTTPTNDTPAVTNYYVSFNANGGTGTMSNQTFTIDVRQALASNVFTRSGFEFRGWALSSAGSAVYSDGAVVTNLTEAGSTIPLYASWMISSGLISSTNVDGVTWHYSATNGMATILNVSNGQYVAAVDISAPGTLTIPAMLGANAVAQIGERAFSGCSSVTNIVIPLGVETIGSYAFAGCTNLSPGITIPESVTQMGSHVFANCPALKVVRYFGDCPDADEALYAEAPTSIISGVLRVRSGWELEESETDSKTDESGTGGGGSVDDGGDGSGDGGGDVVDDAPVIWTASLPKSWPEGTYSRHVFWLTDQPLNRVVFWGVPGLYDSADIQYYIPGRAVGSLPDEPEEREGYTFLGWFTKPYGGTEVTEDVAAELIVDKSFSLYAHWQKDSDPENLSDVEYDLKLTYTYDGYILDADGNMAGTIQLKTAKGKWDKANNVTNVTAEATVMLLGEGKVRLKGVLGKDLSGTLTSSNSSDGRELEVALSGSDMVGTFNDCEVVGARNIFAKKTYLDRRRALSMEENWKGYYVVVLRAESDESSLGNGYIGLSVQVKSRGKARVSGTMPDGTKVAYTGNMEVFDDNCVLPVVVPLHAGKKGGFGFLLSFSEESGVSASAVSEWSNTTAPFISTLAVEDAGDVSGISSGSTFAIEDSFEIDGVEIDESLLPADVEVAVSGSRWSTPKSDRVKFDAAEGSYEVQTEYGNPAALSLSASSGKGTFRGRFKVFAITDAGKSKKYTAVVNGVVLNGAGYGTATIKKIGSVPVTVKAE